MKLSVEKKVAVGFVLVLLILAVNSFVSQNATNRLAEDEHWVAHTHVVLQEMEATLSTVKDAETGQRGFAITGESSYLEPYNAAFSSINGHLDRLQQLTSDNPVQQQHIGELRPLIADKFNELNMAIQLQNAGGIGNARSHIVHGYGKKVMDDIRALVSVMEGEENNLLLERAASSRASRENAVLTFWVANLVAATFVGFASFILLQDIRQRRVAAEMVRQQREWLEVTLQSIGDAVIATDERGRVSFMNQVAVTLTGWSHEKAKGALLEEVFAIENETTRDKVDNPALRAMREGRIVGLANHTLLLSKDGFERPIDDSGAPITDSAGNIIGAVLVFHDVSERRAYELERETLIQQEQAARSNAELANRTKDEFLATVSHELRTPLNSIMGWIHLMRGGRLDEETTERALETIERSARAQARIIEDILDVSRIISGRLRLEIGPVDLVTVIRAALEAVRPAAEAKDIRLQSVLDSAVNTVSGDPDRLQQVVWNLLSNAIKFTPKGGSVQIRLEQMSSNVSISVIDSGQGIEIEFLPHVFDRFRQADSSTTRAYGGLGLGLGIVRHLVELHGGNVRADSAGKDQGATFTVELPVRAINRPEAPAPPKEAAPASPRITLASNINVSGLRVLAVDDDAETRDLMVVLLQPHGIEVRTCGSAAEALAEISDWHPDVLLSDIGMPNEDGYSFIEKVRALPPECGGDVPAAALTAYARTEDRLKALAAGFQMHMTKPIDSAELLLVVANLAGRLRQR